MRKTLSVILVLLILATGALSVSVFASDSKISEGFLNEITGAADDELFEVIVVSNVDTSDYISTFRAYANLNGLSYEKLFFENYKEQEYYDTHFSAYLEEMTPIKERITAELTALYYELFGETATPAFYISTGWLSGAANKARILEMIGNEKVEAVMPDAPVTPDVEEDLNQKCKDAYINTEDLLPMDEEYGYCVAYGEVDGFIVFRACTGLVSPATCSQVIGKVLFKDYNIYAWDDNPLGLYTLSPEGIVESLPETYLHYGINMAKVHEIVPYSCLCGDVNGDDVLDIRDATQMQKKISTMKKPDSTIYMPYKNNVYDYNEDGYFNVKDATAVQKAIAKIAE